MVLVGASKRQTIERLMRAYGAGLRVFGENRVQEAEAKKPGLPADVEWHLIGPLQSNKVRRAARLFDVIQSVDRVKIARLLDREALHLGRRIRILLEVNLAGEDTKHGFLPDTLLDSASEAAGLQSLELGGLMAIPPRSSTPDGCRVWFSRLRELSERARELIGPRFGGELSMGMSGDFAFAIAEGATYVRIGTALFGERPAVD